MFRKVTLALAAAASLGVIALSPTAASAKPPMIFNPKPHFHHHWHPGFAVVGYPGCYQKRLIPTPFGLRWRTVYVCAY